MSGAVHRSMPSQGVALIEIYCPPANALSHAARLQIAAILTDIDADVSIRAVVVTGRGYGFCAGDDLREVAGRSDSVFGSLAQFGDLLDQIEALRIPVIAAVNGHCIGGGLELALCCDIRLAAPEAKFVAAGVNVGLMASVHRLPRLIGIARAKAMILTGKAVDAPTALNYGLVSEIHEQQDLLPAAIGLAAHIATRAPLSVEASKRMIGRAFDLTTDDARKIMAPEVERLIHSQDYAEGASAFAARRSPTFKRQ
jgi:enoyl-CoA hydratase